MSIFPSLWPVEHPDRIQLYSVATPNGVKASIALEELELPYEVHKVSFAEKQQFDPGYLTINPNNKIPAIIDPNGPGGEPIRIMESGAILHYLATKAGRLLPADPARRNQVLQWMFFQVGSVGPMFGQYGHFHSFAPKELDHTYAVKRYTDEAKRLLGVVDRRLEGREWIAGEYSIADIMLAPWLAAPQFYKGPVLEAMPEFPNVVAYLERFGERPAVQRGRTIPG